jgi:hypothetical protein
MHKCFCVCFVVTVHKSDMADNDRIFYCNCSKYCKRRKPVSSSTWYNHEKYRDNVMATFGAFEATAGAGTSSAVPARQLEQPQHCTYTMMGARPLRMCQRLDGPEINALANQNQVDIHLITQHSNFGYVMQFRVQTTSSKIQEAQIHGSPHLTFRMCLS